MELTSFITRAQIQARRIRFPDARFYDTTFHAPLAIDYDFVTGRSELCPFTPYGGIPIPGMRGTSESVEGIWQGLKLIDGKIDSGYFSGKGRKRYGKVKGHQYGDRVLPIAEAREKIYIPSYEFMLKERVSQEILEEICSLARAGEKQFFFDVDENADPRDTSSPLAHSAVLVSIINKALTNE